MGAAAGGGALVGATDDDDGAAGAVGGSIMVDIEGSVVACVDSAASTCLIMISDAVDGHSDWTQIRKVLKKKLTDFELFELGAQTARFIFEHLKGRRSAKPFLSSEGGFFAAARQPEVRILGPHRRRRQRILFYVHTHFIIFLRK